MKQFEYESTTTQMDEALEYSRSPEISTANKEELEKFLLVLRRHFSEILPGNFRYQSYQGAVQHIEALIATKRPEKQWYEKPLGIVSLGLLIAVIGGVTVWAITQ
ncbi:hypothetical protein CWC26_04405 [Pseudoalteromonas sp. S4488]|uniref:hypothetical protein n=1 Tax=unclassified Pseudoalteromonas TaxID=194690 RepID=UPI0010238984|nr:MULTISPECIES: hypothetical protein [unclassified Pseudoalteromonas]RZF87300.1 hypothetical protein EXT43_04450 [Pseudoalteromonas sp. CO109Y]TMO34823.1 hypothetical protein CWC27_12300 [Pseudoalteromonas sp. S4491]TMO40735.1 hypothetical protein CWC26_04405 [Pseudoalteromonas sp. S4488]